MQNNFKIFAGLILSFFLYQSCATPSTTSIRKVQLQEAEKVKGTEKESNEQKLPPAVKEVTPHDPTPRAYITVHKETLSRKDYIKARFPGKKVSFPEEIKLTEKKPEYWVGPDDVLHVFVWNQPDLTMDVTVRRDGFISLPLVGNIKAEGLTIPKLEIILNKEFKQFIDKSQITVNPKEINSLRIFIVGRIRKPDLSIGPVRLGFILR